MTILIIACYVLLILSITANCYLYAQYRWLKSYTDYIFNTFTNHRNGVLKQFDSLNNQICDKDSQVNESLVSLVSGYAELKDRISFLEDRNSKTNQRFNDIEQCMAFVDEGAYRWGK